ncbi:MAG: helix-turn-helix domain-containing protein [Lachnospiraceae bacterium]|nr:helix-turn-helix domain-containing protein [Lachnospiraceae bacterium]
MNQQKIGSFLKKLRNEKGITQEQLAEQFNVSSRTVSRWENGNNMPDISILVEISEFYDVDIREIIDGERKSENMTEETKDVLVKAAAYTNLEKEKFLKALKLVVRLGLTVFTYIYMISISGIAQLQGWCKDTFIILSFMGMSASFSGLIKINQLQENMGRSKANKLQMFGFTIFYMIVFIILLIVLYCIN